MPLTRVILANLSSSISFTELQEFADAHPLAGFGVPLSLNQDTTFLDRLLGFFEKRNELDRLVIYVPEAAVGAVELESLTAFPLALRLHLTLPESWDASHAERIVQFVKGQPLLKLSLDTPNVELKARLMESLPPSAELVHYQATPDAAKFVSCGYQGTITPYALGDRILEIEACPAHPYWISLTSGLLEKDGRFSFEVAREALRLAETWKNHFEEVSLLRQLHQSVVDWKSSKNVADLLDIGVLLSKLSK